MIFRILLFGKAFAHFPGKRCDLEIKDFSYFTAVSLNFRKRC